MFNCILYIFANKHGTPDQLCQSLASENDYSVLDDVIGTFRHTKQQLCYYVIEGFRINEVKFIPGETETIANNYFF